MFGHVRHVSNRLITAAHSSSCTFSDTLFVDLSQYTEKTVPRLRELFTYWLTKARWHQPSIMILDNLDQLIPPQAEVSEGPRTVNTTPKPFLIPPPEAHRLN